MSTPINLLVIDDDDINIFIIKKIVEKTGYDAKMVAKTNGQLAIDYLKDLQQNDISFPDLILIDINMPVLNGWEFLEVYEKLGILQDSDMYMLSSSVYENDIEKAKTYKTVKGFISKPLSIERLIELFEGKV
ncbi:response regulator [Pedobacter antarcticus]|uniref:Response regulator receiver domain-containing protein n=1 Tax=Pedobacter antarcticus TaxID=34086 RepID=A0A1I2IW67_9SPHI|nr:response regulator [Pedobacter antarcticus]SDM55164.1 Response regulator receiver domain-containing protein [Pedobacter antarcticus]SFF45948.1 Response regulator receiver domain-containing protein [Pedobacter antarcticus]